jgi:hypothetical protein
MVPATSTARAGANLIRPASNGWRGSATREQLEYVGLRDPDETGAWTPAADVLSQLLARPPEPWERQVDMPYDSSKRRPQ